MKLIDRRTALALAAAGLTATFAAPPRAAWAADPIVIKFSHVVAPDTPKGRGATKFKELAEKYTDGAVKVEIYPNSQLYKDKEELEALQLGAVQMLAPSLAKFGPLGAKEFEVFDLPYIFPDKAALRKITDGEIGQNLLKSLASKGVLGLAYWDNGFKMMTANTPIKTPEDLLGLKLRIQSSKVLEAQMKAWGAVPQVMAFSEVYQALQTGVVDGTENTPSNVYTQKTHEVQKYGLLTDHGYIGYAVITNKKFWDSLPPELRTKLEKAMSEATIHANEVAQKDNDDAIAEMKASGKIQLSTPTADERKLWAAGVASVHQEMASRVGKDLLESIYRTTGFKPSK